MIDDINVTVSYPSSVNKNKHTTDIKIIPNPVKDISVIGLSHINSSGRIIIYNSSGIKILDEQVDTTEYEISGSELSPGFYYVMVITEDEKVYTGSFVVQ